MAIPEGFTQLCSGFWQRSSDKASPFVFDGTNMTILSGTATTPEGDTVTRTFIDFNTTADHVVNLIDTAQEVPCTAFIYAGTGDTILVEYSDVSPSGTWTTVKSVTNSNGWVAVFVDQATKGLHFQRTAGSSTDSLVIISPEMIVYPEPSPVVAVTGSRDLSMTDDGTTIIATAGITLTIPTGLTSTFNCEIALASAGTVTVAGASGVTVNGADAGTKALTVLDGSIRILYRSANNFAVIV